MHNKNEQIALLKKGKMKIQIRYNTNYKGDDGYPWRLLKDDEAILLIDSANFYCPTFTSEDVVEHEGKKVKKWHLTCYAKELKVTIELKTQHLIAHIK